MQSRPRFIYVPRNFAVFALIGHVGGAVSLGLAGAPWGGAVAVWGAFAGAALGGFLGVVLGIAVLRAEDPYMDESARAALPPIRPWIAIGAGVVASVVVTCVSFATDFNRGGFLEGSPCDNLERVQTLVPLQYTCVYSGGLRALVSTAELSSLTVIAMAGGAAIVWGLWKLRRDARSRAPDRFFRALAGVVAAFLVADGVLGIVALTLGPAEAAAAGSVALVAGVTIAIAATVAATMVGILRLVQRPTARGTRTVLRSPYAGGMNPAERQSARTRQHLVVGLVLGALLLVALAAPWIMNAVAGPRTVAMSPRPVPPASTQPAPEPISPEFLSGFTAPRGAELSAVFTLDQAIAASQEISDLSVAAAGPINDPNIAPGTTSFPVYPVGCLAAPGGQVDHEVWFDVDDVPAGIERVRALWESKGYTLDPTSSTGRYGYVGDPSGPVDLVSIEDKGGTIKLRVASVCATGAGY